jgi:uncharacterized secreted repeat protein (TIGR03808 family)
VRNMLVTGNVCRDSGETAIYAEFAFENAVISDNVVDGAANGISAPNLDQGGHGATISGNIVRNLHTDGPYDPGFPGFGTGIGVEADAVVTGNLIDGAPLYGINAGWGPFLRDVVVSSNTIRDARIGIGVSAADGAGRALIRGNMIAARETGIQAACLGRTHRAGPARRTQGGTQQHHRFRQSGDIRLTRGAFRRLRSRSDPSAACETKARSAREGRRHGRATAVEPRRS